MLVGYCDHGLAREAISLFNSMRDVKPDQITYTAVLSGCSHGGLTHEGLEVFDSLVRDENIRPVVGHYAMRRRPSRGAGRIEKALEFIGNMPIEPTYSDVGFVAWGLQGSWECFMWRICCSKASCVEPENAGGIMLYFPTSMLMLQDGRMR
ncbi:Pentatricopeptide repeat-containing protein [Platanthera guangdongensis]|uniref:Pentatricopeptide repeat-containing protein n=1 Tax=Platanthera guangdongensis TaxID=2320717 RepID=A0ABR2MI66_9ASPA